jgi:hypothetical protein
VVGEFVPDLWVEDRVLVELKAVLSLQKEHEVQLVNYLRATKIDTSLLINFGPSLSKSNANSEPISQKLLPQAELCYASVSAVPPQVIVSIL